MGMFLVHCDAIWTEECACDILQDCRRRIQGIYSVVFDSLHGLLNGLWIDQGPFGKIVTDAGTMSTSSDCAELKEVHFLCTFWDVAGAYFLQ